MKVRFFSVPAATPEAEAEALNSFLANHRVLTLEKQFVQQGAQSYWSICVSYIDGAQPVRAQLGGKRERIDYREVRRLRTAHRSVAATACAMRTLPRSQPQRQHRVPACLSTATRKFRNMKARLRPDGGVANPRNTARYCCGLRLALRPNPSLSFVPKLAGRSTRARARGNAARDQMRIRSAMQWRQKANALRQASRCAERLPNGRLLHEGAS
jgi:hypothetical protein